MTFATGEALSAGSEAEEKKPEATNTTKKDQPGGAESRYLFVTAEYQNDLIPAPDLPGGRLRTARRRPSSARADEIKREEEDTKRKQDEYQKKVEAGKKKAKELTERFADWYYVVPGDAFRDIVVDRAGLTRDETAPPEGAGAGAGGMPPGFPAGMRLPPGMTMPPGGGGR